MVDLERLRDNPKYIRRGRGLTFAKLAESQYVMEVLGDLPLRALMYAEEERAASMIRKTTKVDQMGSSSAAARRGVLRRFVRSPVEKVLRPEASTAECQCSRTS